MKFRIDADYPKTMWTFAFLTHTHVQAFFFVGISGMGSVWVKVGPTFGEFSISGECMFYYTSPPLWSVVMMGNLCSPKMAMDQRGPIPQSNIYCQLMIICWDTTVASQFVVASNTPPKTNMEPENGGLEDDFPFQTGDFPC